MALTTLTRRRPNFPFGNLVDQFFDDAFFSTGRTPEENGSQTSWLPAVDLSQTEDRFVVRADLPGMKKDDIDVTVENNTLLLHGERKFENREEKENFNRIERAYGSFTRSFQLPTNVDATKVAASFQDGVLTIEIPKTESAKSRKIAIG